MSSSSSPSTAAPSAALSTAELHAKYRPVFARIAEGALDRELTRTLPVEQIRWLKDAGFTGVRVPREKGGDGATLPQLFELLVELAAADSHIPQAFRGHLGFVEDQLYSADSTDRDEWLARFVNGELVGNAVTEIGNVALGDVRTKLTAVGDNFTISGSKYYTTGSIFAEWIDCSALRPDGVEVAALVSTATPLVAVSDDWTGFGQKLTGSGTAVFSAAPVEAQHVYVFAERFPFQASFYQLILVAVAAGVARASATDAAHQVANRSRTFSHGNSDETRNDPQVLEIVGRISANATAALAITLFAAEALQRASEARDAGAEVIAATKLEAEIRSAEAQIVGTRLALECATALFDGLGASAVSTSVALDRHWRNVRTVTSHNPVAFKARIVGDWLVNQAEPPYEWAIGVGRPASTNPAAGK
jgi:alkylation response protein AidB-like acyl-CoA dehydrogenase